MNLPTDRDQTETAMPDQPKNTEDLLDQVLDGWAKALPEVDLTAVSVSIRIGRLASLFNRAVDGLVRPHGFGYGELEILFFLLNSGKPYEMRPSDLMKGCFVTSGAVTGRVDRLTKLGLVQRIPSLIDRRETTIRLTRNGEKLTERLQVVVACNSALTTALTQIGSDRAQALDRTLKDLHGIVEALGEASQDMPQRAEA